MSAARAGLAVGAAALVLGACGGGSSAPGSGSTAARTAHSGSASRQVIGRSPGAQPGCSTAVAPASELSAITPRFVRLGGPPFGVAVTADGRWAFVAQIGGQVAVVSLGGAGPRVMNTIRVPRDAVGVSLTADGRYLLVADGGDGATVIDVAAAEAGGTRAVLGSLVGSRARAAGGAIEVTSSPDGRYAFVSVEGGGRIAVYNLAAALESHFRRPSYVGLVPLGRAVVGMAISPDGRWLYATSEFGAGARFPVGAGTLSVIDLRKAEHDPAHSVVANVAAHCSPVRVVVSADGRTVWVTARESDELLAFSASKLITDPGHALLSAVRVGAAPVGLALVNGGRDLVVADSNRFQARGAHADLRVIDTARALADQPAIVGEIPAGAFPREMALDARANLLLVGNFGSNQLEVVPLANAH